MLFCWLFFFFGTCTYIHIMPNWWGWLPSSWWTLPWSMNFGGVPGPLFHSPKRDGGSPMVSINVMSTFTPVSMDPLVKRKHSVERNPSFSIRNTWTETPSCRVHFPLTECKISQLFFFGNLFSNLTLWICPKKPSLPYCRTDPFAEMFMLSHIVVCWEHLFTAPGWPQSQPDGQWKAPLMRNVAFQLPTL